MKLRIIHAFAINMWQSLFVEYLFQLSSPADGHLESTAGHIGTLKLFLICNKDIIVTMFNVIFSKFDLIIIYMRIIIMF